MARKTRPTEPDTTHHPDAVTRLLTPAQSSAVLLLVAGRTDAETAGELGVHRCTVSQWKNHHPAFIAELNQTRDTVNAELSDRVRVLASAALRAIGDALESDARRPGPPPPSRFSSTCPARRSPAGRGTRTRLSPRQARGQCGGRIAAEAEYDDQR